MEEARRRAEFEHGAAQEALATAKEACKKAEEENGHLADEKLALVIELGALKDDFAAFRKKVAADRESMEAKFDSSGDTLFNYGYCCCDFMYNICGSKPIIPNDMSNPSVPLTAEFFTNLRCPPGASAAASALDRIAVSGEDRSENSPAVAGEEVVLPTDQEEAVLSMEQEEAVLPVDQEEAVLSTDLSARQSLSSSLGRDLFYLVLLHQTICFFFSCFGYFGCFGIALS